MSAWAEKNVTKEMAEAAAGLAPLFKDDIRSFSPQFIRQVEEQAVMLVSLNSKYPPKMLLDVTAPYYGEIIRKSVGGEWIAIIDFMDPCLYYIRYGSYLIHSDAEIIWMLVNGWEEHLQKFYQGVTNDILALRVYEKKDTGGKGQPVYNSIFPDWYLNRITKARENQREERGSNSPFLFVTVPQLNQIHQKS